MFISCLFTKRQLIKMSHDKKVGYVFHDNLLDLANNIPVVKGRAQFVHQLIAAYGLLEHFIHIEVTPLSENELREFHSEDYIEFLQKVSLRIKTENIEDIEKDIETELENYGLLYDCALFSSIYETISYLAASTIEAARSIIDGRCDIVLNWFGGWHHGLKDEASGFCYTNDIVFGILTFLKHDFKRILYIDLDLHHGNGVESAFGHTDKVLTFSLHKYDLGFFPGTGDIGYTGYGTKGKYHSINMPLKDGTADDRYIQVFQSIIPRLVGKYQPQVIICQCGADGLNGDRMNSFNLTLKSIEQCLKLLLEFNIPLLLLGGGGYHLTNTARLWTSLSAIVLNRKLSNDIPDHDFFLDYRPSYELAIEPSLRPDSNEECVVTHNLEKIYEYIAAIAY